MPRKTKSQTYVDTKRDQWDTRLTNTGHTMTWELGPESLTPGHAYHWRGQCAHCGATITVLAGGTSCWSHPDARTTECRPELQEVYAIEARHRQEQITQWGADLARANAAQSN